MQAIMRAASQGAALRAYSRLAASCNGPVRRERQLSGYFDFFSDL